MSLIKRMRRQKAVYWKRGDADHHGHYAFEDPVEIKCRWDDGSSEFRNSEGEAQMFNSTVYVDRPMDVGDMIKRGEVDSDTPDDPTTDANAFVIQKTMETPNLRNTETLYTVFV